jgi:hypothetical protein
MKLLFQEHKRRKLLPLLAVALAGAIIFLYLPLDRKARNLDIPIQQAWKQLAISLGQSNTVRINFAQLTNNLQQTREAVRLFDETRKEALRRIELPPALRTQLQASFQLVDYENERGKELDELAVLAKKAGVAVDPPVYAGFPAHTTGVLQPSLLWAELAMVDGLLKTAIDCRVQALHTLEVQSSPAVTGSAAGVLSEIPILFEFTGPVSNVINVLQSLPLRADELKGAGLPGGQERPPLFIDRILIKKQTPEKQDEVRVLVRVVGFVFQE